jgi:hypothetical protein
MSRLLTCCLFAASMLLAGPVAVSATPKTCVSDIERQALDTRVYQTELLVAGLSCGQSDEYNKFVAAHAQQLQRDGGTLISFFKRLHGGKGEVELNEFVTRLANDSSTRSQKIGYGYCYFTYDLFVEALATQPADFHRLTSKPWIPVRHGFRSCDQQS